MSNDQPLPKDRRSRGCKSFQVQRTGPPSTVASKQGDVLDKSQLRKNFLERKSQAWSRRKSHIVTVWSKPNIRKEEHWQQKACMSRGNRNVSLSLSLKAMRKRNSPGVRTTTPWGNLILPPGYLPHDLE